MAKQGGKGKKGKTGKGLRRRIEAIVDRALRRRSRKAQQGGKGKKGKR